MCFHSTHRPGSADRPQRIPTRWETFVGLDATSVEHNITQQILHQHASSIHTVYRLVRPCTLCIYGDCVSACSDVCCKGIWSNGAHLQLSCHYLRSLIISSKSIGQTLEYEEKTTDSTKGRQKASRTDQEGNSKFIKAWVRTICQ